MKTKDQKKFDLGNHDSMLWSVVESTYLVGYSDPTQYLEGRVFVRPSLDSDSERVLGRFCGRLFDPFFVGEEIRSGERDGNLEDEYDNHDQDTHELYSMIYQSDGSADFRAPWKELQNPFGTVLVVNCMAATEYEGSRDWVEPVIVQAFLDRAEHGVNMTLVDMRDLILTKTERAARVALFAKLGFCRMVRHPFLMRDPKCQNRRVRVEIPEALRGDDE